MEKIKVLRIIARLNIGGPAIHAILLSEGLNKEKFESLLVYGSIAENEGDMYYYAAERKIKIHHIPELKRQISFFSDLTAFFKILFIINREKPQIIHTHTAKAGTLGRWGGLVYNCLHPQRRVRLLHTFHGHVFDGYFNNLQTWIFILIERFLAFFTAKIITVSESVKKELIAFKICKPEKIQVILLGLELDKFLNITLKNNKDNIFNVGIVGRLVPIKNHKLFLDVAAMTLKDHPDLKIKFKVIGEGELAPYLHDYVSKLDIIHSVEFLGWQKDLVKIYSELDLVMLTSLNEGTPVSVIEAMAAGRIVVATDVGGVRDLLGKEITGLTDPAQNFQILERGILTAKLDCSGLSQALSFVIHNQDIKTRVEAAARDYVKNNFTKSRLIKDIESLYRTILK